ncbi:MAG: phosphoenolpyruvate--protein phosphotransferase [Anaerolineae bacterium]
MIGLVLVSHSHRLAEGVRELAEQMSQGRVPIAAAGGLDDETIGTNAERILTAIEAVYQTDGVLVLVDLGSAVMSAEIAREMLAPEQQPGVRLSNAPIVEGAIAAAVAAAMGDSLDTVAAAARGALATPKVGEDEPVGAPAPVAEMSSDGAAQEIVLPIRNKVGLHARPAALFVQTAGRFGGDIRVRNVSRNTPPADAKSMFAVLGLNGRLGDEVAIQAAGPDADAALAALRELVEGGFGEEIVPLGSEAEAESVAAEAGPELLIQAIAPGTAGVGIAASPGIAIGPAFVHLANSLQAERRQVNDPAAEVARLDRAAADARDELARLAQQTRQTIGAAESKIFEAQSLFLDDPAFIEGARQLVRDTALNAEAAMADTAARFAALLEGMEGDVFRQRAADVRDVGARVIRLLGGGAPANPFAALQRPAILIAPDLTPSETAQMDKDKILGLVTAEGGATSHTAILARSLGIPAVVGMGPTALRIRDGAPIIVDGAAGQVWLEPDAATTERYAAQRDAELRDRERRLALAGQPGMTADGRPVAVMANVGNLATARKAREDGAEGVGLLRTEFVFLDRSEPPSEDEQVTAYRAMAEALEGRPITVRTLDIGGDKPAPYLNLTPEANPFLGVRAIRLTMAMPDLFKAQLRAILRVSADFPLKIMFPMIATVEEMRRARAFVRESQAELAARQVAFNPAIEVGAMVEIPSAALAADILAREADFFSLGTNDLVQYTFAVDRTNPRVAEIGSHLTPAILRQIDTVVRAAHACGRPVSVCGEMGSDTRATALLVGLGVDTLSVNPAAVPDVKAALREIRTDAAAEQARQSIAWTL